MAGRKVVLYYAWSRPGEIGAPLEVIENRFPTLFESRRLGYPRFEELSDPSQFDQSVAGFLDHIMKRNFTAFVEQAGTQTGQPVLEIERGADDGSLTALDAGMLDTADTLIIISFDSFRTRQEASSAEIEDRPPVPPHSLTTWSSSARITTSAMCPIFRMTNALNVRSRISTTTGTSRSRHSSSSAGSHARSSPASAYRSRNRFGLRPAAEADGSPSPIEIETALDQLHLLRGVNTFNLHPHLPHLERLGEAVAKLDVLARQKIDLTAPPHPFTRDRTTFDALLQSRPDTFAGTLLISDTTLWSSTAGGVDSLRQLWANIVERPYRS